MRFMVTPKKMRTSASRMVVRWYSPHLFNVSIYFGIGIYLYNYIYRHRIISTKNVKPCTVCIYIYVYVFPSIAFFQRTLSHINGSPWIQYSDKDSRMKSLNIYLSSSWNRVSSSHHGWFKTKSCSNGLDDLPCPKLIETCKYTHTYITLYSIPFHSIPLHYIHTYIYVHTYVYVHMYTYIYIYIHNIYNMYIYIQAYNHIIYIYVAAPK